MIKKIVGIFICMLLIFSVLPISANIIVNRTYNLCERRNGQGGIFNTICTEDRGVLGLISQKSRCLLTSYGELIQRPRHST